MKKLILSLLLCASLARAGVPFSQVTSVTVANSTTEATVLSGTVVGSATLPNSLLVSGRRVRITVGGVYSTTSVAPTITIRLKLGGVTIGTASVSSLIVSATNTGFTGEAWVTIRGSGAGASVVVSGQLLYLGLVGISSGAQIATMGSATPVSTDFSGASSALDCTVQFSTANASNSVTVTNFFCEID